MADPNSQITIVDGSMDWSGGVDSLAVTTVQSQKTPNGLQRNELAWLDNATVRDGGIIQRTGWALLGTIHDGSALYQGGYMYEPDNANPYLMLAVGGQVLQVFLDPALPQLSGASMAVGNVTAVFTGTGMPASQPQYNFVQAEQFLVIQAGDNVTLPLFWDGNSLRRSLGITNPAVAPGTPGVNEIPAATAMDYYMGRLWYAQGRQYSAGDIVKGPSGTAGYKNRDSVLEVTENPLVLGGDGFTVPDNAGNIRALFHNANLNTALGQGQLFVGTRKAVYNQQVPVTRADWIAATNSNQPLQTVVQIGVGPVNDRSVVKVNGDIFYQTLEPAISSLFASVRYFNQWGNRSTSSNEERILSFSNRALLHASSGIVFDNRLLMTALPLQIPQGIVHQAIVPLDFTPISEFGSQANPVWEGMMEGLQILQLFTGDFGGLERAFAVTVSTLDSSIQLWEITDYLRSDFQKPNQDPKGEARVTWYFETPAFTWGDEFSLKKLVSLEIWLDKLFGTADITVEYRDDSNPCWQMWTRWKECSARNSAEDCANPISYPLTPYRESFRATRTLPKPPLSCDMATGRPAFIAHQFQIRMTIKGWLRIRGLLLHAERVTERLYHSMPTNCA